ncbi:MBL fold metallo-hydrolase [Candidatus Giovannonibacteria bacterium]|nr:MBL fold metallo-hydrolase [Candidatus Giovannonibacteria bacterium]
MLKVSFFGAAQEVTGSCFLLDDGENKILIDCGLFQSPRFSNLKNNEPFLFNSKEIDALFISHAHIDHTGRIPKLMKEGFQGKIYSSIPTRALAELMLRDSIGVLTKEAEREGEKVLYSDEEVDKAMQVWEGKEYHEKIKVGNFEVSFYNAGHVMGSAMIEIAHESQKFLFTGDLGNVNNPLLNGFEKINGIDYLFIESTYGDRTHEDLEEKKLKLERVIERSVVNGGVLMIPAFSLERTQELLWEISDMLRNKQIPNVPLFLDSPLAIKATEIYQKYYKYLNKAYVDQKSFSFLNLPNVHPTLTTEESKKINDVPAPKIIIAGSGMSTGGRILHHERRYLQDPKSTLLFIGYQAPGSLGRIIQDGASSATIFGEEVLIRAHIENIHGYSAHPDENTLFEFIREKSDTLKKVFTIHGEPKSSLALVQKVRDYLGIEAYSPKYSESVTID